MRRQSIWAVAAGALVIIAVTGLIDFALYAARVYPPLGEPLDDTLAVLGTSYRVIIGVGGAWLTARLAPDRPMRHALILGWIGTALGFIGLIATWNQELGPRWYPVAHVVLAIPEVWLGGKIFVRMQKNVLGKNIRSNTVFKAVENR